MAARCAVSGRLPSASLISICLVSVLMRLCTRDPSESPTASINCRFAVVLPHEFVYTCTISGFEREGEKWPLGALCLTTTYKPIPNHAFVHAMALAHSQRLALSFCPSPDRVQPGGNGRPPSYQRIMAFGRRQVQDRSSRAPDALPDLRSTTPGPITIQ